MSNPTIKEVIDKIKRILDGEEGPKWEGNYETDARYTYPERLKLIRLEVVRLKTLLDIHQIKC